MALGLVVLAAGCDLKFPGPHINVDIPDASALLHSFAGNGSFNPNAAGSGSPQGSQQQPMATVSRPADVVHLALSVNAAPPPTACPPGSSCLLRAGVARQCATGSSMCQNGMCCPAGMVCGANGGCERAPGGATFPTPGQCSFGTLVTHDGTNCPPTATARCCPPGSTMHCVNPSDPSSAVCMAPAFSSPSCPGGYLQLVDSVTSETGCCVNSGGGTVELANGQCLYADAGEPECSGTLDPATGACCAGGLTQAGRCCSAGHQACGSGCCELGESCDSQSGQCIAAQPASAPVCPQYASRDCSSLGGQCCPADSQCKPDGTCSCPPATPIDCGGFCASSVDQCSCPSDHPDACGTQCCLHGGCQTGAAACGCPTGTTSCGDQCCPSGSQCVNGLCLSCPAETPTMCATNCCGANETCNGGACMAPAGTLPNATPDAGVGTTSLDAGAPKGGPGFGSSSGGASGSGQSSGTAGVSGQPSGSGTAGAPSGSGGAQCAPVPASCSGCTVNACASVSASGGCHSWYQASDGMNFECAGCGDCAAAAQAAVQHCCPLRP